MYKELENYVGDSLTYRKICDICNLKYQKGNSKISQIKDIQRYFEINKVKTRYNFIRKYDNPLPKDDMRKYTSRDNAGYRKEYRGYLLTENEDNLNGVYAIVNNGEIYVGSTCDSFRSRFQSHINGKQKHTKEMIQNGGVFQILWVSDIEDEIIIREIEQMYIDYFMANPDWKVINIKEETVCLSEKTKYKNRTIKVDERQYELALEILHQNGIMIGDVE